MFSICHIIKFYWKLDSLKKEKKKRLEKIHINVKAVQNNVEKKYQNESKLKLLFL